MRRSHGVASAAIIVAVSLAACQPAPSSRPSPSAPPASASPAVLPSPSLDEVDISSYRPEAGPDGGTVTVGARLEPSTLNPLLATPPDDLRAAGIAWAGLLGTTHDLRFVPVLAERLATLDNDGVRVPGEGLDAMTVRWTLRADLHWSDGAPLTCDDFRYAWSWVLDPANTVAQRAGWDRIGDFECESARSIVVHYREVDSGYLSTPWYPLPRHHLEAIPMAEQVRGVGFRPEDLATLPVSGPFRVASRVPGEAIEFVRNERFVSRFSGHRPHLDGLTLRFFPDGASLRDALADGRVDVALDLEGQDVLDLEALGLVGLERSSPAMEVVALRPNWSRGLFAALSVRQAAALAIDRAALVAGLPGGYAVEAVSVIPPAAWYFTEHQRVPFDPDAARDLLDAAGWTDPGDGGPRRRGDLEARVQLCTSEPASRVAAAGRLAADLAAIGIEVTVTVVDPSILLGAAEGSTADTPCVLARGDFDLALTGDPASLMPADLYARYHSSEAPPTGRNLERIADVELDAALEAVRSTADFVVMKGAMAVFQGRYLEVAAGIPLYVPTITEFVTDRLGNQYAPNVAAGATWNVADWFIRP